MQKFVWIKKKKQLLTGWNILSAAFSLVSKKKKNQVPWLMPRQRRADGTEIFAAIKSSAAVMKAFIQEQ